MGAVEDYINGLEGRDDLNPLEVARDLFALHKEETGIYTAKINELSGTIAAKDSALADTETKLTQQKAKNFDLAMQLPAGDNQPNADTNEREVNSNNIRVSDLFSEDVRNRHALR